MASRGAFMLVKAVDTFSTSNLRKITTLPCGMKLSQRVCRCYSARSSVDPPDVTRLAQTAKISLTSLEAEEILPKIQQVVDWFGQLQAVDLQSVEPAIRADTESDNLRGDIPESFPNRDALIAAIPNWEESYIKVPKVLNKE